MNRNALLIIGMIVFPLLLNCDPVGIVNNPKSPPGFIADIDGNVYTTVVIGSQTWTTENLKTTRLNDGTGIPKVESADEWCLLTTPGYCWYDNNERNYKSVEGALYNWYAVNTGKLAPTGWHVSTAADWDTLQNYLITHGYNWDGTTTGNKIAKSLAGTWNWSMIDPRKSYLGTPTDTGTIGNDWSLNNRSGFTASPSGLRTYYDGNCINFHYVASWWSTSEDDLLCAFTRAIDCASDSLDSYSSFKTSGRSVRLVKNN